MCKLLLQQGDSELHTDRVWEIFTETLDELYIDEWINFNRQEWAQRKYSKLQKVSGVKIECHIIILFDGESIE